MDADFFLLNNNDPFFEELVKDENNETLSQLLAINTCCDFTKRGVSFKTVGVA